MYSPHSLKGSSDQSLQSRCMSHTFSMLIHSPLGHLNLFGPSQWVAVHDTWKKTLNHAKWTQTMDLVVHLAASNQDRKGRLASYHWYSPFHHSCPCSHIDDCTDGYHGCKYHHRIQTHQDDRWDELEGHNRQKFESKRDDDLKLMTLCNQKVKNVVISLPQSASSDRSRQSAPPSHFQLPWMHSPLPQRNSREEHWWVAAEGGLFVPQFWGHSSELSGQSVSPSQAHSRGTQTVLLHWKAVALQVTGGQEASSLPSSQSASSSHTKEADTHWPFLHRNSVSMHCLGTKRVDVTWWSE